MMMYALLLLTLQAPELDSDGPPRAADWSGRPKLIAPGVYELRDRVTGTYWSGPDEYLVLAHVEMVERGIYPVPIGPMRRPLPEYLGLIDWRKWRQWHNPPPVLMRK